tara:strand:- start:174 stop:1352 length:1179 start_codon:yes stop_codon:yes gene_type:complete
MNIKFLNLGSQPLANKYPPFTKNKQKKYSLNICFNTKSKVISISKKMKSEDMFNEKYPYRSSMSQTMKKSFKKLSTEIIKRFNPKLTLEIGSNDGALITNFKKKKVIGVEPCSNLAKITRNKGFKTYDNYWNLALAKKLKSKHGSIDLIYSANTITHISNLNVVFKSIDFLLNKNGVLIIEDPSLLECIKNNAYDQFYNEHIYIFSALSLSNILKKNNMKIFDIQKLKTHGGSLRYFIKKNKNKTIKISNRVHKQILSESKFGLNKLSTYKKFALNVKKSKNQLIKLIKKIKKQNKIIIGYGATAKAVTVLNYCKIDNKLINFFLDTTPEKQNKLLPGTNIKIFRYDKKLLSNIKFIFLGAWNFKKEIFKKEKNFIKRGGKFLTHVPIPKIL